MLEKFINMFFVKTVKQNNCITFNGKVRQIKPITDINKVQQKNCCTILKNVKSLYEIANEKQIVFNVLSRRK